MLQIREVGPHSTYGILDHGAAIDNRKIGECSAEVPGEQRMGMPGRCDGSKLRPRQQLIGGDKSLSFLLMVFREIPHALSQFIRVGQEKGHIESPRPIQEPSRLLQIGALGCIGSSFCSGTKLKE